MNLDKWTEEFSGKKILVWGYGMEGRSTCAFLRMCVPEQTVTVADSRNRTETFLHQIETENPGYHAIFDDEIDFGAYDMIIKSPGIVVPEGVDTANITGQAPLFLKMYRDRIIGITGTKGKSTTTSLTAAVLNTKYRTHLVGNIGRACFDVIPDMEEDDLVAFEISCHQLEYAHTSPHTAVYLNLFEEHLDHYGSFAAYGRAKDQIFLHQEPGDVLIIGEAIKNRAQRPDAFLIGRDINAEGHELYCEGRKLNVENCSLIGEHNYRNLAVVWKIASLYGISDEAFLEAAAAFAPLHHRLENLGEHNGIRFVDDSISTIGQSCIQAVTSLPETDTVLVGGMDRGIDYTDLKEFLKGRDDLHVIFMYASGKRVFKELSEEGAASDKWHVCEDLAEAVELGRKLTREHHICLLSPAASSYDHFKNFEERGDVFRKLAFEL